MKDNGTRKKTKKKPAKTKKKKKKGYKDTPVRKIAQY